jgi:hypothetical protein
MHVVIWDPSSRTNVPHRWPKGHWCLRRVRNAKLWKLFVVCKSFVFIFKGSADKERGWEPLIKTKKRTSCKCITTLFRSIGFTFNVGEKKGKTDLISSKLQTFIMDRVSHWYLDRFQFFSFCFLSKPKWHQESISSTFYGQLLRQ